jgi:hypothetical protein
MVRSTEACVHHARDWSTQGTSLRQIKTAMSTLGTDAQLVPTSLHHKVSPSADSAHEMQEHPEISSYTALKGLSCTHQASLSVYAVALLLHSLGTVSCY